jgi:hypothetical protein
MKPIRHYFQLQFSLLNRHISEFGLVPWLGYLLSALLFVGLSFFIYYRTVYAPYLLLFGAFSALLNMGERSRNDFLKTIYPISEYRKIRLFENGIIALPFLIILLVKSDYWVALSMALGAIMLAFVQFGRSGNFTLPTPFWHWPFEFAVGFRRTFLFHLLAYFLAFMAIMVGNFNLGVFSLVLVFMVSLTYYSEMEATYYVWINAQSPKSFLWNKIKTGLIYSTLLSLPIVIAVSLFNQEYIPIILAFQLLGYAYLTTIVLAKYSAFPNNMGLPQSILLALSFTMPPLLLFAVWHFYRQSTRKLQPMLP